MIATPLMLIAALTGVLSILFISQYGGHYSSHDARDPYREPERKPASVNMGKLTVDLYKISLQELRALDKLYGKIPGMREVYAVRKERVMQPRNAALTQREERRKRLELGGMLESRLKEEPVDWTHIPSREISAVLEHLRKR
jgi:hypothetical protein